MFGTTKVCAWEGKLNYSISSLYMISNHIEKANSKSEGASVGSSHRLPNQYRGNGYANRYPSNSPINRISIVTNYRNNTWIVASGVYTWVRLKTSTEIYGKTLQSGVPPFKCLDCCCNVGYKWWNMICCIEPGLTRPCIYCIYMKRVTCKIWREKKGEKM
jgi:hypothetical protein